MKRYLEINYELLFKKYHEKKITHSYYTGTEIFKKYKKVEGASKKEISVYFEENNEKGIFYIVNEIQQTYRVIFEEHIKPKSVREALRNIEENKKFYESTSQRKQITTF